MRDSSEWTLQCKHIGVEQEGESGIGVFQFWGRFGEGIGDVFWNEWEEAENGVLRGCGGGRWGIR